MKKTELICIVCPLGCKMEVHLSNAEYKVTGNKCFKGYDYAIEEVTAPKRYLTSTVKIEGGNICLLPIRSKRPIPKDKLLECMQVINEAVVTAPVKMGDVIISNILSLEIDIIASRDVEAKTERIV